MTRRGLVTNVHQKYVAKIRKNERAKTLGYYPPTKEGEIAAAKKYDEVAKDIFGEFANLNFKE